MAQDTRALRVLKISLVLAVAAFAWLRFSENTVDNDLWGHVLYGQRAWLRGGPENVDTLSWTAVGHPWVNHEYVAEIIMGLVHRVAGGTGLWLMMIGFAGATVGLALREAMGGGGSQHWCALGLFTFSINAIATGFAVRPQLFSMLALVLLLITLRRLDRGSVFWVLAIPILFVGWVNTHGGYLAGLLVLVAASAARVIHIVSCTEQGNRLKLAIFCFLPFAAMIATSCNPWGWRMIEWTVTSVLLPRPNISEWHPLGFTAPGIVLVAIILASLWAWRSSTERRAWWEAAVLIVLALFALRSQRHTPLFGLANLMFTPLHLHSALQRLAPRCRSLLATFALPFVQWIASAALLGVATFACIKSVSSPRIHPFTMEIERSVFPEAAVSFMAERGLTGNTITFFDWGQHVLWRLPENPVSFEGRLDTVYSIPVMEAHWRLYNGNAPGAALDLSKADVALLPVFSPGADWLRSEGWTTVYRDALAEVLLHKLGSFPTMRGFTQPVFGKAEVTEGRTAFPSQIATLATSKATR